ncbi:MAG: hypothetical protein COB04_12345 [Gammaproteobacteria bacterium]|nr:MAG: hypothetical protein COB04_12345 [Gammaproteobacteria bacterium]
MMKRNIDYHKKKFIIIEDHAEFRSSLKQMMKLFGANNVETATSGDQGIGKIIAGNYDIVLCDYELGKGKDGQQVLEETRHSGLLKSSSIFVLITAATTVEMVMGALEYEPDGYITKPITHENLKSRLDRIVRDKQAFQEIDKAIDNKKIDLALLACDKVIAVESKFQIKAYRFKSKLLLKIQRYKEAAQLFQDVLDIRYIPWAKLGLGKCAFYRDQHAEAISIFEELAKEDKRNVEAHDWLAKVYASEKKYELAQTSLLQAVKQSPKSVLRQNELGKISKLNKDWEICEKAYRKSVSLGKDSCFKSPDNYTGLTKALQNKIKNFKGRPGRDACTEAIRTLEALEKDYGNQKDIALHSIILRGETSANQEKTKEADMYINKSLKIIDEYGEELPNHLGMAMAECFEANQQDSEAAEYRKKYDVQFINFETLNGEGVRFFKAGKYKQAVEAFRKATQDPNASVSALLNATQACIKLLESEGPNPKLVADCTNYFKKLEDLAANDSNFARYKKLHTQYKKYELK